jgi:hypothetical protein
METENALLRRFAAFVYSAWSENNYCAQWISDASKSASYVMAWLAHFDGMDLEDADLDALASETGWIDALCGHIRARIDREAK